MSNELLWKFCAQIKYGNNVYSHVKGVAFQQDISRHHAVVTVGVPSFGP